MATMEHKGFIAKIDYDADIDSFFACVVNVSSPITFYGKTTAELREEFARSVDAWKESCQERGLEPEKPYSGRLTIRMKPEVHRMIASAAAVSGKSLNTWVVDALQERAAHAQEEFARSALWVCLELSALTQRKCARSLPFPTWLRSCHEREYAL